jgi:subtilisin family serine protease
VRERSERTIGTARDRALRRALLAVLTTMALCVPAVLLEPAGAGSSPTGAVATGVSAASRTADRHLGTHAITLLTGDVVALHVTADGRQAAWIADPVSPDAEPQIYELDGQLHVLPAEATPYVASGALDESLFNVTLLAESGYDDQATDELPLLIEAPQSRASSVPEVPEGTGEVRVLDSVDTIAVTADKADIRTAWEAIRGPNGTRVDSSRARLADGVTVWLNEKVRATLDESVAQVGAPQAWARGYDGDGTTVAVLDTGYDPNHPDLVGRVAGARDFSGVSETAVDGHGHGTHVASTVGGSGAAADGDRKGVAPGTDLLIGKVLDDNGEGYTDQIIAGIEWAVDQGVDVVNMSLGTDRASDGTDLLSQAVNDLSRSSDTLFVVAAGNTGPKAESVGSPGAADLALTVGAVDKHDEPAAFSSRGPRIGDGAIKPEITAPGVDIVAARAAGTSLGSLLDEHYTSLSGTSMATPHVAGAAAVLAQQHPDWTPAQLKARLVSAAETKQDQPVTFQGGGRLDVAAAIRDSVSVDQGTLNLGRLARDADPITGELTYRNASDRRVSMHLSADVTGTGSDSGQRPALRLSDSTVSIPAGGSTTVTATLEPRSTESGGYAGQIVARPVGGRPVHTTAAFTVDAPVRTLTVEATDRTGQPATGPVDLWSVDTGQYTRGFLRGGVATFAVPEGLYSLTASIEGVVSRSSESTLAAHPELRISSDRTLRLDARGGRPLRVETPRPSDLDLFNVLWHRSANGRSMSAIVAQGDDSDRLYSLPSPEALTGAFTIAGAWQLRQPLLTVGAARSTVTTSQQASSAAYADTGTLPLVDAGDGTPEAFAAVDADGAVAIVSRRAGTSLAAQASAASAAGAEVLLAYNNTTLDRWTEAATNAAIPVYRLDQQPGQTLLDALDRDPDLTVDLHGLADSTYQYELAYTERDRVPDGRTYRPRLSSLASVTGDYRQSSARQQRRESWIPYFDGIGVSNSMAMPRTGPLVRTDYVNTNEVEWQRFGVPHIFLNTYWTASAPQAYRAGERYRQVWWGPLVRPAVPATGDGESPPAVGGVFPPVTRHRDAIRVNLPHYAYGGSLAGTIYTVFGDSSRLTLERDGEVIGTDDWPRGQWTVPADRGWYDLTLDVSNGDEHWSDTSVSTHTAWHFASTRTQESGSAVPLVQVDYGLDTDAYNAVPADTTYPLVLEPGYQPGAYGPGRFAAEAEVSFDDGASWQTVRVKHDGGRFRAEIPAAAAGYASVRIIVTDAEGNRLTQQIDRAWKIAAP